MYRPKWNGYEIQATLIYHYYLFILQIQFLYNYVILMQGIMQ